MREITGMYKKDEKLSRWFCKYIKYKRHEESMIAATIWPFTDLLHQQKEAAALPSAAGTAPQLSFIFTEYYSV